MPGKDMQTLLAVGRIVTLGAALATGLWAGPSVSSAGLAPFTMTLWEGAPPGLVADAGKELTYAQWPGTVGNVSVPAMTVYLPPKDKATGVALVYCSGGSYNKVSSASDHIADADYFVARGMALIVVKYRTRPPAEDYSAARADGKRAVRIVRHHAREWGLDPAKIGMLGGSAGANLILNVATHWDRGQPEAEDSVERESCRPDFIALLCPWPARQPLSDFPVDQDTPPALLCSARDDPIAPTAFAEGLAAAYETVGVPVKLWTIPKGGHTAFTQGRPGEAWREHLWDFMKRIGLLEPLPACLAAAAVPPEGEPLVWYTFDEPREGRVTDRSAWGHDGILVGDAWEYLPESGGRRGVLRLDGHSYVEIPNSEALDFGGDMSFEMWTRLNAPVTNRWAAIFGEWPATDWYVVLAHWHTIMLYHGDGEHRGLVPVQRSLIDEEWAHVAMVVEYPRCRFYRNGELVRDAFMVAPGLANRAALPKFLGGNKNAGIPIDLDEFRLYRRALTPQEVAAHARGQAADRRPALSLGVETNWYHHTLTLRLTGKHADYTGHTAHFAVDRKEQEAPMAMPFESCGRFTAEAVFPLPDRDRADIRVRAALHDPEGRVTETLIRDLAIEQPRWVDNTEGLGDDVPPPWTPVQTERRETGIRVGVWGRDQVFGASPLVRSLRSQDRELLASPVTLSAAADGVPVLTGEMQVSLEQADEPRAVVRQTTSGEKLRLDVRTVVEYDGYMTVDCTVEARQALKLEALTLDIPLRSEFAELCYGDRVLPAQPGVGISPWFSGAVEGDLAFRFGPTIVLSDSRRGLLWQAESDEHWHNADPQQAIKILPRGDTTYLRQHWVDQDIELSVGDTLRYRFALQALPIKPLARDAWDLRIVRYEPWGREFELPDRRLDGRPATDVLREAGVRRLFTRKADLWPWPMPLRESFKRDLHRLVGAVHDGGLKLHPYVIHQRVPVLTPAYDPHGRHMARFPIRQYLQAVSGIPARPSAVDSGPDAPPQGCIFMCPKSGALQDAYIQALADRVRTFGEDGIYLDGTVHVPPCGNGLHGCGYTDSADEQHTTYPVFAVRRFMQRIYRVVKSEDPDHVIDNHCSWGYNPAALAYGDTLWSGEQWHHLRHTHADHVADELTLDQFRTEFTGWQVGVAAETLSYRLGSRMEVAAVSLLHDIPVRPSLRESVEPGSYWQAIIQIWDLRDRFEASRAEKLYYFENENVVQTYPERVHATLLRHPENGVLALIANLHPDRQQATVHFDLEALNLSEHVLSVSNGLTGETLELSDGILSLALDSHEWVYVWLQPGDRRPSPADPSFGEPGKIEDHDTYEK
ncbi:MAG: DUF6067 family protein [Candidatus Marinimicrobia bacterium]|nr:DUF6067 family protein [Candidatus Neomarinimicrobiota bacterium]